MIINLYIELDHDASKDVAVTALRDAANRAAGQIHYDILPWPLPVDEGIRLGSDQVEVRDASLFRDE